MTESYQLFRELLLEHLKLQSGGPSSRGPGNGRRPAALQLLPLLLLGAIILLLVMVRHRLCTPVVPCRWLGACMLLVCPQLLVRAVHQRASVSYRRELHSCTIECSVPVTLPCERSSVKPAVSSSFIQLCDGSTGKWTESDCLRRAHVRAAGIQKISDRGAKLGRSHSEPRRIPAGRRSGGAPQPRCASSGAAAGHGARCPACGGGRAVSQTGPRQPTAVWDSFSESWDVSWGRSPPRLKPPRVGQSVRGTCRHA